ncbi:MAG TPA: serine/threonine-protein kinase [Candidatus Acidoferrales bacterium]|nr:serine/threonine-protein kinase [Candidatus Acidoferrales bacterium]
MTALTKAGRYDLREELGRGTMGVVFHGFDPVIGRDVAVKTLRLSEAGTGLSREELIGRFQTEARAAGLLTHPNIVVVFDAGEEGGLFYITMEFVEGRSLQALIDAHQPFPVPRVLKLMEQVCSALDFAHQHNVVHRDIKPANLMLTPDDVVKITDFGTAKILQFGTAQTAHVMGTPSYMSPEQVKGKPVDGRSDIFSLGVILYELMTGEKPFPGQNITTVIYKIINEEPIPPRSLDSSIHPGLSAVISRALAKNPAERYQSCHELLGALKNYHELINPDATVRMAPVSSPPTPLASRPAAQAAPRIAAGAMVAASHGSDASAQFILPVPVEQETRKKPASLLLSLILLVIIVYSGYRVYPPLVDLWRLAREPRETLATSPKAESAPAASGADSSTVKPDSMSSGVPQVAPPAPPSPAATAPAPVEKPAPHIAAQPVVVPATAVKGPEPALTTASKADNAMPPQKPAPPSGPSAAQVLESRLRAELVGQPLGDKVKIQATANALTLSGSLTLPEHRELFAHLSTVPAGVRVIDDTEYTEDKGPIPASASAGWIWVRSYPLGARILVDGAETGLRTPARLELQAGDHDVSLVRRGFETVDRNVTVRPGQTMQFTETLPTE